MLWLALGTKNTWLEFKKHILVANIMDRDSPTSHEK